MRNLWEALPSGNGAAMPGARPALEAQVVGAMRAGDAVMVKGSLGSKMGPIVKALETRFPGRTALDEAAVKADSNVLLADRPFQYRSRSGYSARS